MNNEEHAKQLADAYSAYLRVDNNKEMHMLDESVEDTLTRLEELENCINMLQAEREKFETCDFTAAFCKLNVLCQRIHKLDEMTKKVLQDVEALEPAVDKAEANLISTEGKLKSMLKPLFFMKSDALSPAPAGPSSHQFTPYESFKAASFFPKDENTPSQSSSC